ncbi:hypothetical protein LSUE1_G003567 [Lachnellula suecica]|uniref:Alpha-L-rhamnosidase n=1 Tax=Lachnellula suecica TaxID=602035 RepID=A0A8T9CBY7_9HELO|nr:hypothetical protein LSUE1_G003567 [Lachnellula suecica]
MQKYDPLRRFPANRWLAIITMLFLTFIVTFAAILSHKSVVAADSCWRDTVCTGPSSAAFPGTWDQYNYSPSSRTVSPARIYAPSNSSFNTDYPGPASLKGNGSLLVFDFGKEVGGIVTVAYSAFGKGSLGLAFTEAKNWTGEISDSSNGSLDFVGEGAIYGNITSTLTGEGSYTMPIDKIRGGFRYLSVFVVAQNGTGPIEVNIKNITLEIGYQPSWSNMQAYQGYFSSSDDLLNRIWYSGAYTLQTNAIPPATGRLFPVGTGWENTQDLNIGSNDSTIYVDGSKRDRTVWAGDLTIALPSIMVSTGDLDGVRNTIQVLYNDQNSNGNLPFAGPGLNIYNSDTYHMATMIGTYDYFLFTNDMTFLSGIYDKYKAAMAYITAKIDSTGLLDVTGTDDWGRLQQGGHNTEANMLMYRTLVTGSALAGWSGDSSSNASWSALAVTLKTAVNNMNWDNSTGAFQDSDTDSSINPQDGNSMALFFGVAASSRVQSISKQLTSNWISIGSVAPELPNNLVGFGQSFEIKGHLAARQATRALDLIRNAWGWYINHPDGTGSTTIEGYLADGTFGYRDTTGYGGDYAYTSHAHGWGTGPTDALTSFIVGMTLTAPGGSTWQVAPQFGDLTHAEGGFTTPLGQFSASWTLMTGGYELSWGAPAGTVGTIILPAQSSAQPLVQQDNQGTAQKTGTYDATANTLTIKGDGGTHSVKVTY